MRTGAVLLAILMAAATIGSTAAEAKARHHAAAAPAAAPADPYAVKWKILGTVLTLVAVTPLLPLVTRDLEASVPAPQKKR